MLVVGGVVIVFVVCGGGELDQFVIPTARCIVGCTEAKQTRAKHLSMLKQWNMIVEAMEYDMTCQLMHDT